MITKFRIQATIQGEFEDEEEGLSINDIHEDIEEELVIYFADSRSKLSRTSPNVTRIKSITLHKEKV